MEKRRVEGEWTSEIVGRRGGFVRTKVRQECEMEYERSRMPAARLLIRFAFHGD